MPLFGNIVNELGCGPGGSLQVSHHRFGGGPLRNQDELMGVSRRMQTSMFEKRLTVVEFSPHLANLKPRDAA